MRRYLKTKSQEIGRKASTKKKCMSQEREKEKKQKTEMEKLCCKLREEKELGKKREND